jgi:hypothetical protein
MNWLDCEYEQWGDESEAQRVARVEATIDRLQLRFKDATDTERDTLLNQIAALQASIADFGY